jgi:hypothetical protein
MKKDCTRDYITAAFRLYAATRMPDHKKLKDECTKDKMDMRRLHYDEAARIAERDPELQDILAVERTLQTLERAGKNHIISAVRAVYFTHPQDRLGKSNISDRVRRFGLEFPASERSIYLWLKEARVVCATYRGLRVNDYDTLRYCQYINKDLQ